VLHSAGDRRSPALARPGSYPTQQFSSNALFVNLTFSAGCISRYLMVKEVLLVMPAPRTRSASAKVTEEEYAQFETLAQARGITVGEWCREVLLNQLNPSKSVSNDVTLLAEVLGVRMIVINLFRALGSGEKLTPDKVQAVIEWADKEKLPTAVERLQKEAH
jgi:hypothetical protein